MILTVKIAPLKHWCEPKRSEVINRQGELINRVIGLKVRIFSKSVDMKGRCSPILSPWCEGQAWYQELSSVNEVRSLLEMEPTADDDRILCEHMLEMD